MLSLAALVVFVLAPALLGYATRSYWASGIPAALLIAAVVNYVSAPGGHGDEVDVLPALWIAASVIAVGVCLAGAAGGRSLRAAPLNR